MRRFFLVRDVDETGCSGIGLVAQGLEFDSGRAVMEWLVPPCSINIFGSVEELIAVHGHAGKSLVQFVDERKESTQHNGEPVPCPC